MGETPNRERIVIRGPTPGDEPTTPAKRSCHQKNETGDDLTRTVEAPEADIGGTRPDDSQKGHTVPREDIEITAGGRGTAMRRDVPTLRSATSGGTPN